MTTCAPGHFIDLIRGLRCQIFLFANVTIPNGDSDISLDTAEFWKSSGEQQPIKFIMTSATEKVIRQSFIPWDITLFSRYPVNYGWS